MSDDELRDKSSETSVEGTIKAVTGLVDKIPVYQDAVQPVAKETGKALRTVGKAVNTALIPVKGLIWGIEQIEEFVCKSVSEKMKNIPPENIQTPDPSIAGPILESLRFTGHKDSISNLYANLLATSMDKETAKKAHPGFSEIIKQLSPDEASLISHISTLPRFPDICSVRVHSSWAWSQMIYTEAQKEFLLICDDASLAYSELSKSYLDNFRRLQVLEFRQEVPGKIIDERQSNREIETNYVEYVSVTEYGQQFIDACVGKRDKNA